MNNLSINIAELSTTSRSSALPAATTPSPISAGSAESVTVHKEVGADLLERGRARHRKQGDVPYPLHYTSHNLNFDTVDHVNLADKSDGLTLQILDKPPRRVLDLGCGGGAWVISAAQQWQDTTFIGFDIHQRQPNLSLTMQDKLAERVQWVHGNFLETLPFPDGEFDFARMQNIGLGVPEDEWQNLIEEVVRILLPGGSLEIIEEDIIFPCPETPSTRTPRASPTMQNRISCSYSRSSGSTVFSEKGDSGTEDSYNESLQQDKSRSIDTVSGGRQDQRDHSTLKEAFMQMLNVRFINPQVLAVLPFYLQAAFEEVQSQPGVQFVLPPPSRVVYSPTSSDSSSHLSMESSSSSTLVGSGSETSSPTELHRLPDANNPLNTDTRNDMRARMHLFRLVETVRGCKEAIWTEYEKLHLLERAIPNSRLDRDDFDMHFHNWECDMQDRIGMRDVIRIGLNWPLPPMLPKPEWCDWREKGDSDDVARFYAEDAKPDIVRSLRGFVCRTPVHAIRTGP